MIVSMALDMDAWLKTNLTDAYDYVTEHLDQAIPVDLVLWDFAKAFIESKG